MADTLDSAQSILEIDSGQLPKRFPEFLALAHQCRFRRCMHLNGPNCAVKEAVEQQTVALTRYKTMFNFRGD